jgi:hypothetical protein
MFKLTVTDINVCDLKDNKEKNGKKRRKANAKCIFVKPEPRIVLYESVIYDGYTFTRTIEGPLWPHRSVNNFIEIYEHKLVITGNGISITIFHKFSNPYLYDKNANSLINIMNSAKEKTICINYISSSNDIYIGYLLNHTYIIELFTSYPMCQTFELK